MKALRWATYPGDITASVVGQVMGPNDTNEYLTAIEATYDPVTDSTRVGFRFTTAPEWEARQAEGARIFGELFKFQAATGVLRHDPPA